VRDSVQPVRSNIVSITTRKEQHKERLRRLILDTAERLFVDAGNYDAVSMRKIAKEINYSATTIYLYFRDKDELFQTLLRETFRQLSRAVTLAVTDRDPMVGLYQAMRACIYFGLEHPQHYRLLFMVRPSLRAITSPGTQIGLEAFNLLRHQAGLCINAGRIREIDQDVLAQGAWAVVHGVTSTLLNRPELDRARLIKHVLDSYLSGLLLNAPCARPATSVREPIADPEMPA
jgi:AcrR family transcriptional regulator